MHGVFSAVSAAALSTSQAGQESNQTPIGLTTHGYSIISRAAIRLVERGYSGANVLKRVPSLESYFSGRCFRSFQLSAPVTVCASLA